MSESRCPRLLSFLIYRMGGGGERQERRLARRQDQQPPSPPYSGGVRTSEAAVLPYIPYPSSPVTGCPLATQLPILQPRRTSQLGALMSDPITGIEVPVLAVTLHPQTRQWLTLGGTYCNPLTKTLAPLEVGGPMKDPATGDIVPILGVGLDEHTGLATLGVLHPAVPVWPGCPVSPSLTPPSCSSQTRNCPRLSFHAASAPNLPSLSPLPSLLPHRYRGTPKVIFQEGSSSCQYHVSPVFLPLVLPRPCCSSLWPPSFFSPTPCLACLYYQGSLSYLTL